MMNKVLCFKSTRRMHESGYRYIQYGYMTYVDGSEQVEIIGEYDIVRSDFLQPSIPLHLDLTKSGWFRIISDKELEWQYGGAITVVNSDPQHLYKDKT